MPFAWVARHPLVAAIAALRHAFARHLARRPMLAYLTVFTVAGLLSVWVQATPTFADPDSFYHAKMALLISERGIFTQFPWLQFTVLRDSFADHQFLYHVLLIPWVRLLPPLLGLKLATVTFFATAVTAFYALLRTWGVPRAGYATALLLATSPFVFRANLAKAQPLAFAVLFVWLILLTRARLRWLAATSFFYVWLYGGWPLMVVLAGLYAFALVGLAPAGERRAALRRQIRSLGAVMGGILLALLLHPYFPYHLQFYWNQIVQIAVINYQETIGVGGEWYPYPALELLAATSLASFVAIVGLTLYVLTWRRQAPRTGFLLLATALLYALTLRSRRNVEYLVPISILFSADALRGCVAGQPLQPFWNELKAFLREQKLFLAAVVLPLLMVPYLVVRDVSSVRGAFRDGIPLTRFAAASAWLRANTPPDALVFHSDWDDFPMLWYYNSQSRYLVGLDPTFMYRFDRVRYGEWERVTTARERVRLYEIVAQRFGAQFVFVGKEQESMRKLVAGNPGFREVYRDPEATIFEVSPVPAL
ncbi:MAG: hypothetical protein G01um101431_644 [Parcubacteria group bacterium Gr01-1014_31]|nr:MAG: hypothetical protein G01um101431_644 [Parcubacteria group bacterium Gr01-1014_31]